MDWAYYSFDADETDLGYGSHDGEFIGTPEFESGMKGNALHTSENLHVKVDHIYQARDYLPKEDITVCAWFKGENDTDHFSGIVHAGFSTGGYENGWSMMQWEKGFRFTLKNENSTSNSYDSKIVKFDSGITNWTLACGIYNHISGKLEMYVNTEGVEPLIVAEDQNNKNVNKNGMVDYGTRAYEYTIGAFKDNNTRPCFRVKGRINR